MKARDGNENTTAPTTPTASATTDAADGTAPTPDPMSFLTPPAAISISAITMTAADATDPNGVEYYFTCTAGGGNDSGWQNDPVYTDTGLDPATTYSYTVKARDQSVAANETDPSDPAEATTNTPGPGDIVWGSPQDTTAPTDIVNAGTLVTAFHGDAGGATITVNGVDFAPGPPILTAGNNSNTCDDTGPGAENESLEALLDTMSWGAGSFEITGLTPGTEYLLQILYCDMRFAPETRYMAFGDGDGSVNTVALQDSPGSGAFGQFTTATFIADGTSQTVTVAGFQNAGGGTATHVNAYQVRSVIAEEGPQITSITVSGGTATLMMTGKPLTTYICKSSSDLVTAFSEIATAPPTVTTDDNGDGTGDAIFTVDASAATRFYLTEEPPPVELLSEDFESDNGGFTNRNYNDPAAGTDWTWGPPTSPDLGGGEVTSGSGGSAKCWGTGLDGAYIDDVTVTIP